MKKILRILFLPLLFLPVSLCAQLEKVIVEKYYISDQFDTTDVNGGKLDSGSVTYRIYIDMQPGYKLQKIYGNDKHSFKISSTAYFFNNTDRGVNVGNAIPSNRLNEGTVALDTWITLGYAANNYFGILKTQDTNGSIIGGTHNDGGSASIAGGLLVNANPAAGIPLTAEDGMVPPPLVNAPGSLTTNGDFNNSTIFSSANLNSAFTSTNTALLGNGTAGANPDSNQVLVAQLTTTGMLSFELNIVIKDTNNTTYTYVANDSVLAVGEQLSRYLKYPFHLLCGCPDPNYKEYNPTRDCDNKDSCKHPIVFGCMDPLACNYNPNANFSVSDLCCYPGYCNDENIAIVCETILGINSPTAGLEFNLFPNPANNQLNIQISYYTGKDVSYELYNYSGSLITKKNMGTVSGNHTEQLDISNLDNGLYLVRLYLGNTYLTKKFVKD